MAWTWVQTGAYTYEATRPGDAAKMRGELQAPNREPHPDRPLFCLHGFPDGDTTKAPAWEVLLNADDSYQVKKANPTFSRAQVEDAAVAYTIPQLRVMADEVGDSQLKDGA